MYLSVVCACLVEPIRAQRLASLVTQLNTSIVELCGAGQLTYDSFEYDERDASDQTDESASRSDVYRAADDDRLWLRKLLVEFDETVRPRVAWPALLVRSLVNERGVAVRDAVALAHALNTLRRDTPRWTRTKVEQWARHFVAMPGALLTSSVVALESQRRLYVSSLKFSNYVLFLFVLYHSIIVIPIIKQQETVVSSLSLAMRDGRTLCSLSVEQLRSVRKWQHRRRLERDAQLVLPLPQAVLRRALAYALVSSDSDDVRNALAELSHSSDADNESDASILADCWHEPRARCRLDSIERDERREELDYEFE